MNRTKKQVQRLVACSELADSVMGWAVFNRGTEQARIESFDDHEDGQFTDDAQAVAHVVIEALHGDAKCFLAVCETFETDELIGSAVEAQLLEPRMGYLELCNYLRQP